jgi:hypothetical protein
MCRRRVTRSGVSAGAIEKSFHAVWSSSEWVCSMPSGASTVR